MKPVSHWQHYIATLSAPGLLFIALACVFHGNLLRLYAFPPGDQRPRFTQQPSMGGPPARDHWVLVDDEPAPPPHRRLEGWRSFTPVPALWNWLLLLGAVGVTVPALSQSHQFFRYHGDTLLFWCLLAVGASPLVFVMTRPF